MKRVGLIGCGVIGRPVARALLAGKAGSHTLAAVLARVPRDLDGFQVTDTADRFLAGPRSDHRGGRSGGIPRPRADGAGAQRDVGGERARRPIVDLALFREPGLASSLGSMMLAMLALFAVSFALPFYLEERRGLSVARAGLLLTPLPLTIAVVALFSGGARRSHRLTLAGEASAPLATARVVGQSLSVAFAAAIFSGLGAASAGLTLAAARALPGMCGLGAVGILAALVRGQDRGIAR